MKKGRLAILTMALIGGCLAGAEAASYTVNVSLSSSTINPLSVQKDLLATLTTGYFLGTATPSIFFANTYSVNLFGRNPAFQAPSVSTTLITLDTITNKLTTISTYTYIVGYAQGMLYERNHDAGTLGYFMGLCDNATNYNVIPSTVPPIGVVWSSSTCNQVLGFMDDWIVTQTSGLAVIPNPPVGF